MGLILMRLVVGSALIVRASLRLGRPSADNTTITSALLVGSGILLSPGYGPPSRERLVALTEIWQILTLPGDPWLWLLLGPLAAPSQC